jgi:hypothetical protein
MAADGDSKLADTLRALLWPLRHSARAAKLVRTGAIEVVDRCRVAHNDRRRGIGATQRR